MPVLRDAYQNARQNIQHPYEVAAVSYGLLLGEVLGRTVLPETVVHANDPFDKQMIMDLPSALPTPEMTGIQPLDTALQIGAAGVGLEAARRTTSRRGLLVTAVGAQALACVVDAGVERSGWLSPGEKAQEDVGFSSIYVAWLTKFLLDKLAQAQTAREKLRYVSGLAAGAAAIVGLAMMDSKGMKLDLSAHTSGALVGVVAHARGDTNDAAA
jgi:hypothetical protein